MIQLYTTGPAIFSVGLRLRQPRGVFFDRTIEDDQTGSSHSLRNTSTDPLSTYLLGTAETKPRISLRPEYKPIIDPNMSETIPSDWNWDGEWATVTADMNVYDEGVVALLQARPGHSNPDLLLQAALGRGAWDAAEVGQHVMAQQGGHELVVFFPYVQKPLNNEGYFPPLYHFYGAILAGPDDIDVGSAQPKKIRMVWICIPIRQADGSWLLYNRQPFANPPEETGTTLRTPPGNISEEELRGHVTF